MKTYLYLAALLVACKGPDYTPKDTGPFGTDSAKDSNTEADTDTDSDSDSDTDSDTDSDSDSDSDSDTDSDSDSDPLCTHDWEVVDQQGWTKYYDYSIVDPLSKTLGSGTSTLEGYGQGWTDAGDPAWLTFEDAQGATAWTAQNYITCDADGALYVGQIDLAIAMMGSAGSAAPVEPSQPRMFLPAEKDFKSGNTWNYNYTATVDLISGMPSTVTAKGTYTDMGFESFTMPDGSKENALKIRQTYDVEISGGMVGPFSGTIDAYYVKKIGLVKEVNVDSSGATFMTRDLTSYKGL